MPTDPAIRNEVVSVYIQLGVTIVAFAFLVFTLVAGYLPVLVVLPLVIALFNQWLRSPLDVATSNIIRIQQEKALRVEQKEA